MYPVTISLFILFELLGMLELGSELGSELLGMLELGSELGIELLGMLELGSELGSELLGILELGTLDGEKAGPFCKEISESKVAFALEILEEFRVERVVGTKVALNKDLILGEGDIETTGLNIDS